jgi:hypothetical protein
LNEFNDDTITAADVVSKWEQSNCDFSVNVEFGMLDFTGQHEHIAGNPKWNANLVLIDIISSLFHSKHSE